MDKRNWKIIYTDYSGAEQRAVELVSREMGYHIIRDPKRYTIHVLSCEKEGKAVIDKNAVVISRYGNSEIIRKYIKESEIPENGYVVKVMDNPEKEGLKLVLITAREKSEVFYGAVDFVDDYFAFAATDRDGIVFPDEIFNHELPDYYKAFAPKIKRRTIFTWGHPIDDYRKYIDNMARLRLNEVAIWNDFVPVNAKDIVDYAHSYGIDVIWGYAWGWSRNCNNVDFDNLDALTDDIIKIYEEEYRDTGADGIYFQSFTELHQQYIGDKLIAEVVTDFVNKTAEKMLSKYPGLKIQFGLHATSVNERLQYIAKVDPRVDIIWENCGGFPYMEHISANGVDSEEFASTKAFVKDILELRDGACDGVLYKGHLTLDWHGDYFVHQSGPFVMGDVSERTYNEDLEMIKPLWKKFQYLWLKEGKYAYEMTRHIKELTNGDTSVGIAAQLSGGIWLPYALCSHIIWDCDMPYDEILEKVTKRRYISVV